MAGNGTVLGLIINQGKLTDEGYIFIACLATSDFLSGLGAIIGTYREDLGRTNTNYDWPVYTVYIYFIIEMTTTLISFNFITSIASVRLVLKSL